MGGKAFKISKELKTLKKKKNTQEVEHVFCLEDSGTNVVECKQYRPTQLLPQTILTNAIQAYFCSLRIEIRQIFDINCLNDSLLLLLLLPGIRDWKTDGYLFFFFQYKISQILISCFTAITISLLYLPLYNHIGIWKEEFKTIKANPIKYDIQ